MMILGAKILRADGRSIREEGRVTYPLGEWVTVPGNGAYVCVEHGGEILSGGRGAILVVLECEEPTGADAPDGVTCYRRVRRLTAGVDHAVPLAEYGLVCTPAYVEYARVCDTALAEYASVRDTAYVEHARVCKAALAKYEDVREAALTERARVCDTAWAEILRGLVGQCGVLE